MTLKGYTANLVKDIPLSFIKVYTYDADNKLLSMARSVGVNADRFPVDTTAYAYDNNGNRTNKTVTLTGVVSPQVTTYTYDLENRLTAVNANGVPGSYQYDGAGRRTKAVINGNERRFQYDGTNVTLEKNASAMTVRGYTRGLNEPGGIGGIILGKPPARVQREAFPGRG